MRLLHRITLHISIALLLLFAVWATLFYYITVDEINDETDDSLEEYSEYIIRRALTGEKLPENDNGTNNSYHISKVTREYALQTPSTEFLDQTVYIRSKNETEPARIYKTIFRDKEDNYYQLTVTFPTFEKKDLKETILYWLILLYVLLLVSIIILNIFVHRRSLKPLYTMLKWLDNVQLSNTPPLLEVDTGITEFRKLSEALTRNACRNAEIYEQQSLFIAHASHELQTPIAIAQNRLEMLSNDSALTEAQLSQILKTKQAVESLSKLNKTLLLLARIENQQFPESEQIDVQKFLAPHIGELRRCVPTSRHPVHGGGKRENEHPHEQDARNHIVQQPDKERIRPQPPKRQHTCVADRPHHTLLEHRCGRTARCRAYLPQVLPENFERGRHRIGIGACTRHLQNL